MQVFISWSGERSKAVAQAIQGWLRQVMQAVDPWISADIEKGLRWGPEVSARLEQSKVGIFCLTPENLQAPWILFEAGAISKTHDAYACTLLLDLKNSEVEPPLGHFQHTQPEKEDIYRLLKTINDVVARAGGRALLDDTVSSVFEMSWPHLEKLIQDAKKIGPAIVKTERKPESMFEEILQLLRVQDRRLAYMDQRIANIPIDLETPTSLAKRELRKEELRTLGVLGSTVQDTLDWMRTTGPAGPSGPTGPSAPRGGAHPPGPTGPAQEPEGPAGPTGATGPIGR